MGLLREDESWATVAGDVAVGILIGAALVVSARL
jgi:hypothetical protein